MYCVFFLSLGFLPNWIILMWIANRISVWVLSLSYFSTEHWTFQRFVRQRFVLSDFVVKLCSCVRGNLWFVTDWLYLMLLKSALAVQILFQKIKFLDNCVAVEPFLHSRRSWCNFLKSFFLKQYFYFVNLLCQNNKFRLKVLFFCVGGLFVNFCAGTVINAWKSRL